MNMKTDEKADEEKDTDTNRATSAIRDFIRRHAPRESDHDGGRVGVLSTFTEYHALLLGLSAGFTAGVLGRPEVLVLGIGYAFGEQVTGGTAATEIQKEPHYFAAGALIGYFVGPVVATLVGSAM